MMENKAKADKRSPYNLNQAIGEWDLGGDGKTIYGFGEKYESFKRK